jgi:transcriptional regulator with XRE-family HTH domain
MTAATDPGSVGATRFDFESLHAELDAERVRRGLTKQRLAGDIGVSVSTISRAAVGGIMEADGVLAMVRWLGVPPERFVRPAPVAQPTRLLTSPTATVRADTLAMHNALDRRRAERGISWEVVGDELGSSRLATELAGLRRGGRTTIATLVAPAQWLGLPIAALTREAER